jgi:hypothetical protein
MIEMSQESVYSEGYNEIVNQLCAASLRNKKATERVNLIAGFTHSTFE